MLSERVPPDSLIVVPEAKLMVLPCTIRLPPSVSSPEPVVIGWLFVVLKFSVPVVASKYRRGAGWAKYGRSNGGGHAANGDVATKGSQPAAKRYWPVGNRVYSQRGSGS